MDAEILRALYQFTGSLAILGAILGINYYKKMGMGKDLIVATLRGLTQLLILSSILLLVFTQKGIIPLYGILSIMILFAVQTIAKRLDSLPDIFKVELVSIATSVYLIMTTMTMLEVLSLEDAPMWIPIGGMVVGNSMNITYLSTERFRSELEKSRQSITTALNLGISPNFIIDKLGTVSTALRVGITPSTNNLRTLGIVFIPGLMTGLLIGGYNPLAAALLQVMIFFLLIGGGLISSLISITLLKNHVIDNETMTLNYLGKEQ